MTGDLLTTTLLDKQPLQQKTSQFNTYLIVGVASFGGFLFGYDTGIVSGAMLEIKHPGGGIASDSEQLPNSSQEFIVSSTIAAAALGSLISGMIQRHRWFGRRTCAMLGSLLFAFGAILMALTTSLCVLIIGRVVVGVAVGLASQVIPIFIAEVAPPHLRGSLTILNNAMIVTGQVIACGVACAYAKVDYAEGSLDGWRWMLGWGASPALFMFFGLLVLPESPRWLLSVPGDTERAMKALTWLRGDEQAASQEMSAITEAIAKDQQSRRSVGSTSLVQRLTRPRVRYALMLGVGIQLLQQCVGVNTIMYYSATILQMASTGAGDCSSATATAAVPMVRTGLSKEDVRDVCMTIPVASCQLLGNLIGMALADRKGRRPLVLSSLMCCSISLIALGYAFFTEQDIGWLALLGMCMYLLTFGIGMSPIPWLVNAEIYPLNERSVANSIATAANWVANFLVAQTFLDLSQWLSTNRKCPSAHPDGAFWLYAAVAVLGFFLLGWKMPETAGKTLEDMDEVFVGVPKVAKTKRYPDMVGA